MIEYLPIPVPANGHSVEVVPGVRWLRMPLPFSLDHINLYLLEDSDGWYLIDTGIDDRATRTLWQPILNTGIDGKPLKGVLITHYHPDHAGLAGWLMEQAGIPCWISPPEFNSLCQLAGDKGKLNELQHQFYLSAGIAKEDAAAMVKCNQLFGKMYSPPPPTYTPLEENTVLQLGRYRWQVIITSGHSPAHACLYSADAGLLIAGDQVLPQISANVSITHHAPDDDPLALWLESLQRLQALPATTKVLPSHNAPFQGLHRRLRQLRNGHLDLLERMPGLCRAPQTALQLSQQIYPRATQGYDLFLAIGETLAHLNWLTHREQLRRQAGPTQPWRWQSLSL